MDCAQVMALRATLGVHVVTNAVNKIFCVADIRTTLSGLGVSWGELRTTLVALDVIFIVVVVVVVAVEVIRYFVIVVTSFVRVDHVRAAGS